VIPIWLIVAVAAVAVTFTFVRALLPVWERARAYIRIFTECGALPPPPTPRALWTFKLLTRILTFIQVGRIRFVGLENTKVEGARLFAPNHGHYIDPPIFSLAFEEPLRYMAARGVFTFGGGLGALLVGPSGAFPADLTPGKGGPAKEAAVKVMATGQSLVLFPEGWAYMDGSMGKFKKGAVRIVREAAELSGQTTWLIPVYMRYGRHPGKWILKFPPPVQYVLTFMLFPLYRRGLTVYFGKAVPSDAINADDAVATEDLRRAILTLNPGARMP
jgi:1-acyl-sn-glycerol-3-phosphate acyltransferase